MKKIIIGIILLGLVVTSFYFYCDKSSKYSCIRNLNNYKAALKVILDNKDRIVNSNDIPNSKWEKQIISRKSIEKIKLNKPEFQNILKLWEKGLISTDYGIMINNDWQSIDFDLPGNGRSLTYLPTDKFTFTCASGQIEQHERLEAKWYYVHYCPE